MEQRYTAQERRFLIACFVAYTAAYISRTNLSPALDSIQRAFGLTAARVGLLPTAFALPYAFGQIVVGFLADRYRPQRFMLVGLMGSAAMNIAFSRASGFGALLTLWLLNGVFQSMIWTPLVRVVERYFRDTIRARALFHISITLIVGYLCAWALSGFLTAAISWRAAFATCGTVTAVLAVGSFLAMRGEPEIEAVPRGESPLKVEKRMPLGMLFLGTDLIWLMIACLMNGYVRDGIMNWAPKLLQETQGISLESAVGIALIIPLVNFTGIELGRIVYRRTHGLVRNAIAALLTANVIFEILLLLSYRWSGFLCALFLAACSAMAYGVNPLITSFLPMEYHSVGRVGFVAGMVDAIIYLGSALSGAVTGALSSRFGWDAAFASWILCTLAAVGAMVAAIRRRMKGKYAVQ